MVRKCPKCNGTIEYIASERMWGAWYKCLICKWFFNWIREKWKATIL